MSESITAIDGKSCERAFIRSGRAPAHLARFLKKYPAAHYLSWVQAALAEWGAAGDFDSLKLLQPSRGQRKSDSGLIRAFTDFQIYNAVTRMINDGHKLATDDGAFHTLEKIKFNGATLSWTQIRERYYRFVNHETVRFVDNDRTMIVGPERIQLGEFELIGFWRYTPEGGFEITR